MPRDLFGEITSPSIRVGSRRWYTVPLSLLVHTSVVLVAVVVPLVAAGSLPDPRTVINFVPIDPRPIPPPPRRVAPPTERPVNPNSPPLEAPESIPPEPIFEDPLDTGIVEPSDLPGIGIIEGFETIAPPPVASTTPPTPVRVGGQVRQPEKVLDVQPRYPAIAQSARVQGVVIIEATIGVDGRVQHARVLRSVPLLDEAALDAVRQWTYTPTMLNGVPVPVIMTVTVRFQLQ